MNGIYDIHTHIIPMVDDGSGSLEESLAIIKSEVGQGVSGIVFTPHFRKGMFEPPEEKISANYSELLTEVKKEFPGLQIGLGCEFHAIMDLEEELEKRRFSTINDGSCVLLEFSGRHSKSFLKERTETTMRLGYLPILAHIERYPVFYEAPELIDSLRRIGVRMQVNADSVLGLEGRAVRKFTRNLLKKEKVDFIASDVHNMTDRASHIGACADFVKKKYGSDYAERIFIRNPLTLF